MGRGRVNRDLSPVRGLPRPEPPHRDRPAGPRGPSLADLPARRRLAMRTEVHVVKAVARLHDRRPAARARLAPVPAHLHVVPDLRAELGRKPRLDLRHAACDDRTYRVEKATELVLAERSDAPLRMEPCFPEDLVGVRVADAGDEGLIHE